MKCKWMRNILILAVIFLLVSFNGVCQSMIKQDPPNIIMILADDMGWADVGPYSAKIETPNLDRLAGEGIRLTSFYASAPMCSPTRAALLTGRYPHSVGMPELASAEKRGNVPILALDHEAVTIPEAIKPHGYKSMIVGKWHLGHHPPNWPRTHGFDEFWGSLLGTPGFYDVNDAYHNETPVKVEGYFTDRITDKAMEFIQAEQDSPFFLYLAYNAPHYPLEAPAELVYKYRGRYPDNGLFAVYAAMIERMDHGIGRVLDQLDRLGLAENTFVVFCSDNGPSPELRSYGLPGAKMSAGPLRGHKFSTHEGGIRVPFLARWPGKILPGKVRQEPATTMDLMPTFLDAIGITPKKGHEMHGVSILPLLTGQPYERRETLHWENQHNMAVRKGTWKLVHPFWLDHPYLYDLENDIGEKNDVAEKHPDIVAELQSAHEKWLKRAYPDPVPRRRQRSSYSFPEE